MNLSLSSKQQFGGLLSAFAVSEEPLLAGLAEELADRLLPAFEGTPIDFPAFSVNVHSGPVKSDAEFY
jgi:mannosyl-oligosaccharide alpha-1,2-mannosidase